MLKGSYVALVTPFKNNKIDYPALDNLIEFHISNGTDGILFCGTTAEAPTYSEIERKSLLKYGFEKIKKRIPIMIGTGTNNIDKTIKLTKQAEEFGADYALVITPYYNKPTQEGLYHYFKEVVSNTNIPIVIYNVPGRTGVNIASKTTIRLANEYDQIIGIKEASGDIVQLSEIVRYTDKDFSCMSGEDALNFPIMACGAKGVISVTANILPNKLHTLTQSCLNGNFEKAQKLHLELLEINQKLFIETNPIPVKESLAMMNMIENDIRLPLYKLSKINRQILKNTLIQYRLINA